MSGTSGD